jgi:hypothetical protein
MIFLFSVSWNFFLLHKINHYKCVFPDSKHTPMKGYNNFQWNGGEAKLFIPSYFFDIPGANGIMTVPSYWGHSFSGNSHCKFMVEQPIVLMLEQLKVLAILLCQTLHDLTDLLYFFFYNLSNT